MRGKGEEDQSDETEAGVMEGWDKGRGTVEVGAFDHDGC